MRRDHLPLTAAQFPVLILRECSLFNTSMHTRFFVSLNGRRLRICEPRLNTTLREYPSIPARANQKKLYPRAQNSEAHGGNLLTLAGTSFRICTLKKAGHFETHGMRVHEFIDDG